MNRCRVLLFARAKESAGVAMVEVELPPEAKVGEVRRRLGEDFPQLTSLLPHCLFAVNDAYAGDDEAIPVGAEIACIPPVSGG
jgi:molybdopterin converting factor subunit 1